MTTCISSETQEIIDGYTEKEIYNFKNQEQDNKKHETFLTYFLIFIFCTMTERPTDKVSYILDALWYK